MPDLTWHTLRLSVVNRPGVLPGVTQVISSLVVNITSLRAEPDAQDPSLSEIQVIFACDAGSCDRIVRKLSKLIDVVEVDYRDTGDVLAVQNKPLLNDLGQPIGFPLPDWAPKPKPPREPVEGQFCRLEPLDPDRHAAALFAANAADEEGRSWTYLPYGPFRTLPSYRDWMSTHCLGDDPLFFAIANRADGQPAGVVSYLRIAPASASIEVGNIHYSPRLQQTPAATEAMYLLMKRAFELGYRRYEWKCDALNVASCAAAQRLGLSFEGIFRQATVYKGRNRDTAWYAAIDADWPALRQAFVAWLDPSNFDGKGRQRTRLADLRRPALLRRPLEAGQGGTT